METTFVQFTTTHLYIEHTTRDDNGQPTEPAGWICKHYRTTPFPLWEGLDQGGYVRSAAGFVFNYQLADGGDTAIRQWIIPLWALYVGCFIPLVLHLIILRLDTLRRDWLSSIRRARGLCGTCGYNLTGNVSGVCPECGTAVPPKALLEENQPKDCVVGADTAQVNP